MEKIVKQVVGIDVAQKELVVCLGRMYDDLEQELYSSKAFANTKKGFETLVVWIKKQMDETIAVRFVMEATGVYHEALAYFLEEKSHEISILYYPIRSATTCAHWMLKQLLIKQHQKR